MEIPDLRLDNVWRVLLLHLVSSSDQEVGSAAKFVSVSVPSLCMSNEGVAAFAVYQLQF